MKKKISLVNIQHSNFEQMKHFVPVTSQQHILQAATCFYLFILFPSLQASPVSVS